MASGDQIKVSTNKIEEASAALLKDCIDLQNCVAALRKSVRETSAYWTGEAGELFRQLSEMSVEEADEAIQELKKYPGRLNEAAGIFHQTEEKTKENAAKLPADLFG